MLVAQSVLYADEKTQMREGCQELAAEFDLLAPPPPYLLRRTKLKGNMSEKVVKRSFAWLLAVKKGYCK
jgi:hypothetical protein